MKRIWIICCISIGVGLFSFTTYKDNFFEISKQLEVFIDLYKELNTNYVDELVPAQVMEKAIEGVLTELDPYTVYRNEQQIIEARINQSGQYAGVGAVINFSKDKIRILECYEDAPAAKAGLKAGDEILYFNDIKVADLSIDLRQSLISGEPGSKIDLVYLREGKEYKTTLERERIIQDAVPYYALLEDNIGYIVLESFTNKAASQTKSALIDLKQKGAKKLILDLRNNPGGLLNESIKIVNLFIDKGQQVTYTKSVIQKYNNNYITTDTPVDTEIPLVVLINERSASASEIVAGSLQDLDRAVIIGSQSFGKGLVQREMPLSYSTQLKITISRYYTPSGRSIQKLDYGTDLVSKRNSQDKNQIFYTKNNRKVYAGGGIMPDKSLDTKTDNDFVNDLTSSLHLFDFTSKYLEKNQNIDLEKFVLKDADWKDFKSFMQDRNSFKKSYKAWQDLEKIAQEEGIQGSLEKLHLDFKEIVQASLDEKLESHRKTIESYLSDILVRRTHYQNAAFMYATKHNKTISIAKNILNNEKEYRNTLKN